MWDLFKIEANSSFLFMFFAVQEFEKYSSKYHRQLPRDQTVADQLGGSSTCFCSSLCDRRKVNIPTYRPQSSRCTKHRFGFFRAISDTIERLYTWFWDHAYQRGCFQRVFVWLKLWNSISVCSHRRAGYLVCDQGVFYRLFAGCCLWSAGILRLFWMHNL